VRHPLSAKSVSIVRARAALEIPDRGIERRYGIGALNVERESASGGLVAIFHALVDGSLDPFLETTALHTFQTREGVPTERDAPADGAADVGSEDSRIHPHHRVGLGRNVEPTKCRPEKRTRGYEPAGHLRTRNPEGIADQHGGAPTKPAAEEEVEANTVWRGDARHSVSPRRHVAIAQLPLEDDLAIAFRQVAARECAHWRRGALQRPNSGRGARDDQREQRKSGPAAELSGW